MTSPGEDIRLRVISTADSRGLDKAARDLRDVKKEAADLRGETGRLGDTFGATENDLLDLNAALEQARQRSAQLRTELAKSGGPPIIPGRSAEEVSILAEIQRVRQELSSSGGGGLGVTFGSAAGSAAGNRFGDGFVSSLTSGSFHTKAIKALVALAVLTAPAIGAIVGGAVVGLVGAGGIAGGIFAASKDSRVRNAANDLKTSLASSFFDSGDAFVGPLQRSLRQLERDFDALDLEGLFDKAAPGLEILSKGVGRFAKNLMPGLNDVMDQSVGISQEMADGLAYVGTGLSDMFSEIMKSEGTLEGLRLLFFVVGDTARGLGNTLNFLADSMHRVGRAGANVSGFMEDAMLLAGPAGILAAKGWAHMNDQMERTVGTGELIIQHIPRVIRAVNEAETPTNLFANAMGEVTEDTQDARGELVKFQSQMHELATDLTTMMDRHFGLEEAQDAVTEATRALREQIKEQREEGVKGAGMLTGMTQAAIDNRESVRDLTRKYADLMGQQALTGGSTAGLQKKFEDELVAMGFAREEARKYAKELRDIKTAMDAIKSKEVKLRITVEQNKTFGGQFLEFQTGGRVPGPVGQPRLAVVHGGEEVLTPQQQSMPRSALAPAGAPARRFTLGSDGSALGNFLLEYIRSEVRHQGGDPRLLGIES